ncbi:MAG TPA: alpha/beta hydrolase [Gammaproteobacteria bacterium]|nr:alpha/beta hydrolase [Gammaproteobacteria bacterium]
MSHITSQDGTPIAYERLGSGPPVILIDGAMCSRAFGPMPKIAALLALHFTVYLYDRRGRGESGDTPPYAKARELEDIEALIGAAGGSVFAVGLSSGAALALEAGASSARIKKLAVYEPPYMVDNPRFAQVDHEGNLRALVAAGQHGAAVKYFMRMVNVPAPFILLMQLMRGMWRKLKAVAPTLPYDMAIMGDWQIPSARLAKLATPTLAMYGGKTETRLKRAIEELVKVLPDVRQQVLPGQTHNVSAAALVPALVAFFKEQRA